MKRILLFLLFAVSFAATSQVVIPQEYTIQKPLRLETVNAGSKSDSVLVRGLDKIVKYVPQSEFGGSLTFDQVITNGSIIYNDKSFRITSGDGSYADLFTTDYSSGGIGGSYGSQSYAANVFGHTLQLNDPSAGTRLKYTNYKNLEITVSNDAFDHVLHIPVKDGTLATLDDILAPDMQGVLNQGGFGYLGDFSDEYATIQVSPFVASLGSGTTTSQANLTLLHGKVQLSQSLKDGSGYQTALIFEDPTATANWVIPARGIPGESNVFQIATVDQLPVVTTKTYKVIINQYDTIDPVVTTELKNDTGKTFTFTRNSAGWYSLTCSDPIFDIAKTTVTLSTNITSPITQFGYGWNSSYELYLFTKGVVSNEGVDGVLFNATVKIEIEP